MSSRMSLSPSSKTKAASLNPPKPKSGARRSRGGQPGNLNAVKHGFYTRRIHQADLADLQSSDFKGLSEEIAILRLFTRRLVERYNSSSDLFETMLVLRTLCFASSCLNRMIKTQHLLISQETPYSDALEEALKQVVEEIEQQNALNDSLKVPQPAGGS